MPLILQSISYPERVSFWSLYRNEYRETMANRSYKTVFYSEMCAHWDRREGCCEEPVVEQIVSRASWGDVAEEGFRFLEVWTLEGLPGSGGKSHGWVLKPGSNGAWRGRQKSFLLPERPRCRTGCYGIPHTIPCNFKFGECRRSEEVPERSQSTAEFLCGFLRAQ